MTDLLEIGARLNRRATINHVLSVAARAFVATAAVCVLSVLVYAIVTLLGQGYTTESVLVGISTLFCTIMFIGLCIEG